MNLIIKIIRMLVVIGAVTVIGGIAGMFIHSVWFTTAFVACYVAGIYLAWTWGEHKPAASNDNGLLRGARMLSAPDLSNLVMSRHSRADLQIGGVPVPWDFETRGFLFSGAPGTGKTVAITAMLDVIYPRDDSGFIADRNGSYTARYFNPDRDMILNPLDARAVEWSPLAEMQRDYDAETIAKSLIPDAVGDAGEWNRYAQVIMSAILLHCWKLDLPNSEIVRLAQQADMKELATVFEGQAAIGLLQNEKMFGSIRGIVSTYTSGMNRLIQSAGRDAFSIKKAVAGGYGDGEAKFIFFPYLADQMKPLRTIISGMADIYADAVMVLPPSFDRRAWLILDEFASLGRVESMENFLTNARKHGGSAILGMQSISQVHALYGRENATSMFSSISNSLTLRAPDAETAEYLSKGFGDKQIMRVMQSGGSSSNAQGDSSSSNWSQQIVTERLVLPAEISSLPDLCGYVKLSGDLPCAPVRLALPAHRPPVAQAFEPAARPSATAEPLERAKDTPEQPGKPVPSPEAQPEPDMPF
ncbi:Type IV secretion-system, TraD, DNA-binding domain protein [Thiomonas sp. X19]|uniref:type IV secretion system DNA-binding domain-containing protein n=1 Tax=Thiomonas sp. X19 TaxID=1050370 RepID=UPI000B737CDA|nr:type IV secretion system DNA-binding domain-containing protein [Thiomonas sp. X19]SCC94403.1 Type IV secretion-system, TraD, DNA-binding domain protein [Thiomonas sp. X19]